MRIVYIAGFFSPVLAELKKRIALQLEARSVIWVPQAHNRDLNVNMLKGSFYDVIERGASDILICAFVFPGSQHVLDTLERIVTEGKRRSPSLNVKIEEFESARDVPGLMGQISAFQPSSEIAIPSDLADLARWVKCQYPATLTLLPRAASAAKNSRYEEVSTIYAAINLLGTEYWKMRTATPDGAAERRSACETKLLELGLELSPSISATRAGEEGDQYFVTYPLGGTEKRMLDLHLKKGSDREERFCLRIYFFWDSDAKRVVIGWLPSHLDTRAS